VTQTSGCGYYGTYTKNSHFTIMPVEKHNENDGLLSSGTDLEAVFGGAISRNDVRVA